MKAAPLSNDTTHIILKGVRQNNLKNVDVQFPLGKLTVVTGLSGSGKSSLVFETLHAEGQRRYVETFSAYTRQFLDLLDKPEVDSVQNIRPSIAIQQSNTVKTSRSTVGTMTELCDYFKVWFNAVAQCYDPETGELVSDDHPERIWERLTQSHPSEDLLLCFRIVKPQAFGWSEVVASLSSQGYSRVLLDGEVLRLEKLELDKLTISSLLVIQDRLKIESNNKVRFIESAQTAQHYGKGELEVYRSGGDLAGRFTRGLHSVSSGRKFREKQPAMFSFNSPLGACSKCRGFGRVIEIDYNLVIPDKSLSVKDGAIRAFAGEVYRESQHDLIRAARKAGVPMDIPWSEMEAKHIDFIIEGHPGYQAGDFDKHGHWYGVRRFFDFLEQTTYKMHVRVFLSKFRSYVTCPECGGSRLQAESLCWKWNEFTLPELYLLPVDKLLELIASKSQALGNEQVDTAREAIINRLSYLNDVGLSYLSLDRSSRTLSGGEVERVNLTACLGTKLTDTLFVLDEPSVGLHARDIDRLIRILKLLTALGNTVVLVEHDEAIMRAADHLIEVGPVPGQEGGSIVFEGNYDEICLSENSITGAYLSQRKTISAAEVSRPVAVATFPFSEQVQVKATHGHIAIRGASKHNISKLDVDIPLDRFVCLTGVSGSGKSTLMNNVLYQGLLQKNGKSVEDVAAFESIESSGEYEVILVDQSAISRTPRSNPALFVDAWEPIRKLFASTEEAKSSGYTHSDFSFNGGNGRCEHCNGLGYERVEMQFLSDVYVKCPVCDGKRFKPGVLEVKWEGFSIAEILEMDVEAAAKVFHSKAKIAGALSILVDVGLGYLQMGQPLNTLSGGESQRLKLVSYLTKIKKGDRPTLVLLDEPTTGLHRDDVKKLLEILQKIVSRGHSLIVIEHHMDVIKSADWVIEIGPEAGEKGGLIVAAGPPSFVRKLTTVTAPYLLEALEETQPNKQKVAEAPSNFGRSSGVGAQKEIEVVGAREHNLKNLNVTIPGHAFTVVTGVSGSGKSSLAFDIIFAEGQRRYMESMSAYARQFVEQLPRPDIDDLRGIAPSVAIEQRVTRGSKKSTVATITEVAQYLRLLYARIGVQHSPITGKAVVAKPFGLVQKEAAKAAGTWVAKSKGRKFLNLCAPVIRGRKGHHQPLANWASEHGFAWMRCDGKFVQVSAFEKLNRYQEHDIEIVVSRISNESGHKELKDFEEAMKAAHRLGKGGFFLIESSNKVIGTYSTSRTDPDSGVAYPELDPKHFSWNSPRGWCPSCRGYGRIYESLSEEVELPARLKSLPDGSICPDCSGSRLNEVSRAVKLYDLEGRAYSMPDLLGLSSEELLEILKNLELDARGRAIVTDIYPQIEERLKFMGQVGINYLSLDRETVTLSGGEAQRIRLASQLGTNLTGVLYVLDEPSIGLHPRDNERLIQSLEQLRDKGNTLVVVEHDEDTMRRADHIIDLGPGAGVHGGAIIAEGDANKVMKDIASLTGQYLKNGIPHPIRGAYRKLPARTGRGASEWLTLKRANLRNLKGDDLSIPLGKLVMVCGVSGAGKSTLVRDLLMPTVEYSISQKLNTFSAKEARDQAMFVDVESSTLKDYAFQSLKNGNAFNKVIEMDQSPIGKTPRSNPSTYIGIFDTIRQIYASTPEAKMRGYNAGTFSFNTAKGRCEECKGAGRIKLEMGFMPDTYVTCDTCKGTRYSEDIQDILWNGKSIVDVLNMSFEEALEFFDFHSGLKAIMQMMVDTGLGYIRLGQSSPTLSGGEAQRVKLVNELSKGLQTYKERSLGIARKNLYILEEPTIGLHQSDCEKLILLLHKLVEQGHTVVVIEHHVDLLCEADYIIEVGPGSGDAGGQILYQGAIEGFLQESNSPTVPFLNGAIRLPR